MMRYRLRTLLILIAIGGTLFARIGYLKRWVDFHRREAAIRITQIAKNCDRNSTEIAKALHDNVIEQSRDWSDVRASSKDGQGQDLNASAYYHEAMASRYERAIYRPWQSVSP
jgi:hypothetical protein